MITELNYLTFIGGSEIHCSLARLLFTHAYIYATHNTQHNPCPHAIWSPTYPFYIRTYLQAFS